MKYKVLVLTLVWLLAACAPVATPDAIIPPTITPPPTEKPTIIVPTPTETGFVIEQPPAVFVPTTLEQSEYKAESGGNGRDELMAAGLKDEIIRDFEEQGYRWLEENNISRYSVDVHYINVGEGDNFRWQIYYTDKTTGNIIWTGFGGGTYPTGIIVDRFGMVSFDPDIAAQVLPDTANADVRFNADKIPVIVSGTPVNINGKLFYPLIRNALTGEVVRNPFVNAALEKIYTQYLLMPATPEEFKFGKSREDVFALMDYLDAHPELSHLTPGSEAPHISLLMTGSSGEGHFVINCNAIARGTVNCALEAFMQFNEQGVDVHVIIWGIRNKDGSVGYFAQYIYDSLQHNYNENWYKYLMAHQFDSHDIWIHTGIPSDQRTNFSYTVFLFQQPGYIVAIQKLIDEGIIPEEFKNMILSW